jgi:hypothetical protein
MEMTVETGFVERFCRIHRNIGKEGLTQQGDSNSVIKLGAGMVC